MLRASTARPSCHLECSPCGEGFFKSTYGSDSCTACTEHATTATTTSTDISACACIALYEPGPDGGPDEPGGTCVSSCSAGTYNQFLALRGGLLQGRRGPAGVHAVCLAAEREPRGVDERGRVLVPRGGDRSAAVGAATLLEVTGLDESETGAYECAGNSCVHTTEDLLPLHRVVLAAAAVQAAPVAPLTVTVARAGVPIVFFACASTALCADVSEVDLRGECTDTVTVEVVGDGNYTPSIIHYLLATASFSNCNCTQCRCTYQFNKLISCGPEIPPRPGAQYNISYERVAVPIQVSKVVCRHVSLKAFLTSVLMKVAGLSGSSEGRSCSILSS